MTNNIDYVKGLVNQDISLIIRSDADLIETYSPARSVLGLGPVITKDVIIKTGNFKTINTATKAASYVDVCRFPNTSGIMVGKSRITRLRTRNINTCCI